ncbi:MAG: KOW domain-containing RNA-binding protein [Defluviitaleaceae bacterium]|nr:KOW domain-containing RNA-binding protein [Defluviitaleaceae bacterium]
MIVLGQIVFSKCGRDKGLAMVVLKIEGEYLYLADGKTRTLQRPKKKKAKHVQHTHYIVELTTSCGRDLQDADIRKKIKHHVS